MNPPSPGRVSIPHRKDANERKLLELLSIHADLASTGMAMVTYVSMCHDVNMLKVETLTSRGAEYLRSTKNDK